MVYNVTPCFMNCCEKAIYSAGKDNWHISMMLKLLVGLSLTTVISGNVINPQNNVKLQQNTNCQNSEVLLKIWTILSGLLGPDGKTVKVPDVNQITYALTLIKKSLAEHPAQNQEPSKKLQHFENELAKNKDVILNDARPLRSLLNADPVGNDLSSNILFRYDLPSNIRPNCKAAFLNLIHVAQEAYVNMAKSPICTDGNAEPLVPNTSAFTYYVPSEQLHQNPFNSAVLSPSEEALKKVTEYLKAPDNYNSNNVMSLLESLQPKVPYVSPLQYKLNVNPQPQINSDALNDDPSYDPYKPDINGYDNTNAESYKSPLQGSFNINLEHAKDIADKLMAQNQYKDESSNANGQPTPKEDPSRLTGGVSTLNFPPNKKMSQAELQKLYESNFNQPPENYPNPFQNQGNIEINQKLKDIEKPNNMGDNFNNNNVYQGGFNNPGSINHNIYQNKLPDTQLPYGLPWPYNSNINPVLDKQVNDANGVANAGKLDTNIRPKGQVELTYLLKRKRPLIYQPFYFVKYRLPYNYFVQNLKQMLSQELNLITPPTELYKGLIAPSNATEVSPDLASYPKEEIHSLVLKDGALVKAKYIEPNETEENDRTKDSDRESSEVNFAGGDAIEQKGESSKNTNGFNSNQNVYNGPVSNAVGLNGQYPVVNQIGNQAALYDKGVPLHQDNQSLEKLLSALGLNKLIAKEPNLAVSSRDKSLYKVENYPYRQENSVNVGNQNSPYLGNQHSAINQLYSPYPVASSFLNPPYLSQSSAIQRYPYVIGNQSPLSQNRPYLQAYQFRQDSPLAKVAYQYVRPSYVYGVQNQPVLSQIGPVQSPYVFGAQAASGLNNKFLGNNLINNNVQAYRQSRRLLGGFLNPNQYGYNRPGMYPNTNGLGRPYPGIMGNQGMLGQGGLGNNFGNGFGQPYLYGQVGQSAFYG